MLHDTHVYYLQTMGIYPWALCSTTSLIEQDTQAETHLLKLVVMTEEAELSTHEALFLKNMMRAIGLDEGTWEVRSVLDGTIKRLKRSMMLVFGKSARDWCINQGALLSSIVMIAHPTHLLQHPLDKKIAYRALGRVNTWLNGETRK
jgi:DNA polymerase III psi subunit